MAETVLDKLRELQQAERQLRDLEHKKTAHDHALRVRVEQIRKHQEQVQTLKGKQRDIRMRADRKELDVRQKRAEIEKLRSQQMQVKDNRQYQVLQNEIKFAELSIAKIEDEILADFGDLEIAAADIHKAEADLARQQKDQETLQQEVAARKGEVDAEIAACRACRDAIARGLPPKIFDQFTRIADRHQGEAMAPLLRDEEGEEGGLYICGGCHMGVTQNTYVVLAGRGDVLCTCPNCTRILYLEDA